LGSEPIQWKKNSIGNKNEGYSQKGQQEKPPKPCKREANRENGVKAAEKKPRALDSAVCRKRPVTKAKRGFRAEERAHKEKGQGLEGFANNLIKKIKRGKTQKMHQAPERPEIEKGWVRK